jgi:hypothetical protein
VTPPSRGKLNAGALAPSDDPVLRADGVCVSPVGGFRVTVSLVPARAVVATWGPVGGRELARFAERAFVDAPPLVVVAAFFVIFLPGRLAFAARFCVRGVLADLAAGARIVLRDAAFADFLRVFLDIRLPFVAFGGSIMDIAGLVLGEPESGRLVGKSYGLGVWLQGFDARPSAR